MSVTSEDIGKHAHDELGRVGVLRDVIPDYEDPAEPPGERRKRPIAFLWPEGGGKEWLVPLEQVQLLPRTLTP